MQFLSDCKDTENARVKEISLLLFAFHRYMENGELAKVNIDKKK